MDRQEFDYRLLREVSVRLDGNVRLTRNMSAAQASEPSSVPVLHMDEKYLDYQNGTTMEELVDSTLSQILSGRLESPETRTVIPDSIRDKVYCAVVYEENYSALLSGIPHRKMEDLAIVARVRISDTGSVLLTNGLCNRMQMTPEEVLEMAQKNTERKEYECVPIGDMIQSILAPEELPEEYMEDIRAETTKAKMYVMTNREKWEGAAAILSPGALEEARKKIGEDYYILPSSRHELILLPESTPMRAEEIQKVVRDINIGIVRKQDRLSDNVYKYDSQARKVSLATGKDRTPLKEPGEKILKLHNRRRH